MKFINSLKKSEKRTFPHKLANEYGIETYYSDNVNNPDTLKKIKEWQPDIIISTQFNHYIGKKVRKIPKIGTWNLHKSFLPFYGGIAPNFYALLNGTQEVGATLHEVDDGFDTGPIKTQIKVPVTKEDTVYSLNIKTATAGGQMLADFLQIDNFAFIKNKSRKVGEGCYYSYPTKEDIKKFKKRGLHFY